MQSRPNLLNLVIRISSWRGVEAPQKATGAIVSASNSQGTEESDKDTKTAHRTNESVQGKDQKRSLWARIFGKNKKNQIVIKKALKPIHDKGLGRFSFLAIHFSRECLKSLYTKGYSGLKSL